ncbi:unnamed protein product, partial [Porites lobata]
QIFLAIHKIVTILLTTPVGSIICERSFSALRQFNISNSGLLWNRSTTNEGRLSARGLGMLLVSSFNVGRNTYR